MQNQQALMLLLFPYVAILKSFNQNRTSQLKHHETE